MARTRDDIERDLWAAYNATRTAPARDALVEFYQPWVRGMVIHMLRRAPPCADFDDIFSAANTGTSGRHGLLGAIERFEPERGLKFTTFANTCVRGAIRDYMRDMDPNSRQVRRADRVKGQAEERAYARTGRRMTGEEMLAAVGERVMGEAPVVGTATLSAIGARLDDRRSWEAPDPDADPVREAQRRCLREYLSRGLDRRDRLLLTLLYFEGMNQREVGDALGVSQSRVSQMRDGLLERLRARVDPMDLGCE
jgi:RNA polymerase sigma factor for flagellar operon FliA